MKQTFSWTQKIQQLLVVLVPILATQVSMFAMSIVGTMMAGQASPGDLAGVAIGANIWMPVFTGLTGILIAVTPMVAQLLGANKRESIPFVVVQGLYFAAAISLFVLISGWLFAGRILEMMGLEPKVVDIARNYLIGIGFGVLPSFGFTVLRAFIDTLGYTRITMMIMAGSLPVNVALNYGLIFGQWGLPAMGGAGVGYAMAATYWLILLAAAVVIHRIPPFNGYEIFQKRYVLSWQAWKEQWKIGMPIGVAIFCETSIFGAVALFMAQFNTATIAAHQAAINFASLLYMLPLSVAMSLTIAVGFEVGARRFRDAKQYGYLGLGLASGIAVVCAIGLFLFNDWVGRLYTRDMGVLEITKMFLLYAAFFQLSDAVATPVQGILRGYKDVNVSLGVAMVSFWVIGLPGGYLMAHYSSFGAFGYWIGLIAGLACGATFLSLRLLHLQKKMAREI